MNRRVQRFRSGEEMALAPVVFGTSDHFERFARHCARYAALSNRRYAPGLFRFRSIEEAQEARARVTLDLVRGSRGRP